MVCEVAAEERVCEVGEDEAEVVLEGVRCRERARHHLERAHRRTLHHTRVHQHRHTGTGGEPPQGRADFRQGSGQGKLSAQGEVRAMK